MWPLKNQVIPSSRSCLMDGLLDPIFQLKFTAGSDEFYNPLPLTN